jgi:hypothetical protein
MLVLLVLAAIAVDSAVEYLARRDLSAAADAAANDAATFGLDEDRFRETGEFVLDPALAEEAVRRALAVRGSQVTDRATIAVEVDPDAGTVTVTLRSTSHLVFAPVIPGAPHDVDVVARATADVYVGE